MDSIFTTTSDYVHCTDFLSSRSFTNSIYAVGQPLVIIDLFTGRRAEYRADKYAYEIGLGAELHNALITLRNYTVETGESGLMSKLYSTHPATEKRIERLRQYVEGK